MGPRKTGSAGAPASPIEHVVIIVKENQTFDNYFGTCPGAAGTTETGLALFLRLVTPFIHHLRGAAVRWLHDLFQKAAGQQMTMRNGWW
jgi:hypothetical protein